MIVVDTNVIAYFIIPGDSTELAETVRAIDPIWAAPNLWRSEMLNLLTVYLRSGAFDVTAAKEYMSDAMTILIEHEFAMDTDRILELANASGCTAYDCEFVALAERLNVKLVTSDKKLLAQFPNIAVALNHFSSN